MERRPPIARLCVASVVPGTPSRVSFPFVKAVMLWSGWRPDASNGVVHIHTSPPATGSVTDPVAMCLTMDGSSPHQPHLSGVRKSVVAVTGAATRPAAAQRNNKDLRGDHAGLVVELA